MANEKPQKKLTRKRIQMRTVAFERQEALARATGLAIPEVQKYMDKRPLTHKPFAKLVIPL